MSIEHWLDERGHASIEVMGWPKWQQGKGGDYSLMRTTFGTWQVVGLWSFDGRDDDIYGITDRAALALLRDHARAWLEARGISIDTMPDPVVGTYYGVHRHDPVSWLTHQATWEKRASLGKAFLDYDAALIAGVLACKDAKPNEGSADEGE